MARLLLIVFALIGSGLIADQIYKAAKSVAVNLTKVTATHIIAEARQK